ncbi:MAG: hypothetical protein IJG37_10455, partial [Synergistaceae bacterium]|nr:hypothetical protein [Synergistaceae bacterium]
PGNYSWFLEKREQTLPNDADTPKPSAKPKSPKNDDNTKLIHETKRGISQCERDISGHEARIAEIDGALCQQETLKDSQRVQSLMTERANLDRELAGLYSRWEELSLKLDGLKG